ncbi:MAG: hypothetical protein WCO71_04465 [Pseudomonadota bacterium]
MIRNNKPILFATLGLFGGVCGVALGEFIPEFGGSLFRNIAHVAIWSAFCGGGIAVALFTASEIYHRRRGFYSKQILGYLRAGAYGGAIAGAVAQAIYGTQMLSPDAQNLVLRPLCWGLMGAILGWRLASTIPNLTPARAVGAGGIGGTLGGVAFLAAGALLPAAFGRMAGIGALGAALGIAIVVVDSIFREATLEIIWAPKEVTTVGLGGNMVTIGGGDDHIYVAGLSRKAAGVVIEQGKIQYVDTASGQRTDLRDGSRLKIGSIEIVVHATP